MVWSPPSSQFYTLWSLASLYFSLETMMELVENYLKWRISLRFDRLLTSWWEIFSKFCVYFVNDSQNICRQFANIVLRLCSTTWNQFINLVSMYSRSTNLQLTFFLFLSKEKSSKVLHNFPFSIPMDF